jgi:hypothetical protein
VEEERNSYVEKRIVDSNEMIWKKENYKKKNVLNIMRMIKMIMEEWNKEKKKKCKCKMD